jgi:hypothetical protein
MKKLLESLRTRPVMGDVAKPDMMSEARDHGVPAELSARALPMAGEEQNEAFGMPGKRNDRQTDTMYNLAMDYKQKFDFETFPVGEHMKDWLASVAGEMKDAGITPTQMRVFLTAAYTFAKGGFFTPKSESAELSEDTIEKILKKMVDDGKLTVDKKGTYTSTLEPVLDPDTKKAMAVSFAKNAKPGPRRDRAVANLSSDPEIQTEMAGDDKAAINGFGPEELYEDREMNEAKGKGTPAETEAKVNKKFGKRIAKVKALYRKYKEAEGPTKNGFKDAKASAAEWMAYTDAGKKLQAAIKDYTRDMAGGEKYSAFTSFQPTLQSEAYGSGKRCNESICERIQACTSEAALKQITEMAAGVYAEALNKDETLPAAIMANYIADQVQAEMQMFEAAEIEEEMDDLAPNGIPETDLEDYEDDKQYR